MHPPYVLLTMAIPILKIISFLGTQSFPAGHSAPLLLEKGWVGYLPLPGERGETKQSSCEVERNRASERKP